MHALRDLIEKFSSGNLPAGALLGIAAGLLLIAAKVTKASLKSVFLGLALAALVGAAWWYFQRR